MTRRAEYVKRGSESQGTAYELNVQGWQCSTIDNGVTNAVLTGCEKDGLTIAAVAGEKGVQVGVAADLNTLRQPQTRSYRSAFMTLTHAATKSLTYFSWASSLA